MNSLVLSLFPGVGLFDLGFELEGFAVVRGPDLVFGGDVHRFHAPERRFDGIIGGPPCQAFSQLAAGQSKAANLIPEFERIVNEANPRWFVMENVPTAPLPSVSGYFVVDALINNRWLGEEQSRLRRFSFGSSSGIVGKRFARAIVAEQVTLENPIKEGCFTANGSQWEPGRDTSAGVHARGRSRSVRTRAEFRRGCRLQGLPDDYDLPGFTVEGAIRAIGNGVPIPMGRAVARAVKAAFSTDAETQPVAADGAGQ